MAQSPIKAVPCVMLFVGLLAAVGGGQAILVVPSGSFPTIQSAINLAGPGDVVQVGPGNFVENLDLLGKEIQLIGAGPDLTTIDGGQAGAVIVCKSGEGPGTLIQGFTLTNGSGFMETGPAGTFLKGGGIYLRTPPTAPAFATDVLLKNCRIVGNTAPNGGGGVYVTQFARVTLDECNIENNSINALSQDINAAFHLTQCRFLGNTNSLGGASCVAVSGGTSLGPMTILDCLFENNISSVPPGSITVSTRGGVFTFGDAPITVENCIFRNNQGIRGAWLTIFSLSSFFPRIFRNCLIEGTQAVEGPILYAPANSRLEVEHCTFTNNTASMPLAPLILEGTSPTFAPLAPTFRNCIFWSNSVPFTGPLPNTMGPTLNLEHCLVQGGFPGPGNISVDPKFVDQVRGIYRLRPDSPAIDAGVALPTPVATDFEGDPRPTYAAPDLGYDEYAYANLDPVMGGNAAAATGNPVDLLFVNGSSGGSIRQVDLAVGATFTVSMIQPPGMLSGAPFVIFGLVGPPPLVATTSLPFGLGNMAFPPCFLLPGYSSITFTLASTSPTPGPCFPLLPAQPTPWTSPPSPAIPVPLTLTFQGVVEETPGAFAVTNGVVVDVR
ncbi:MAG TPA: hypothetical protein ENK43_03965 [Planctomycetes bacterium]|nr:hypothetical protein [Planctomycetota bacterium]